MTLCVSCSFMARAPVRSSICFACASVRGLAGGAGTSVAVVEAAAGFEAVDCEPAEAGCWAKLEPSRTKQLSASADLCMKTPVRNCGNARHGLRDALYFVTRQSSQLRGREIRRP